MLATPAETTEDRTFKLLGLKWSGAPETEIAKIAEHLWSAQRPDGGWAQLPTMRTDGYATGEALYPLSVAGEKVPGSVTSTVREISRGASA